MPDQINSQTIKNRKNRLKQLNNENIKNFYSKYLGRKLNVLVEGTRDRKSGLLKGRSRNYIPVLLEGSDSLKNSEVGIQVITVEGAMVSGRLLSDG